LAAYQAHTPQVQNYSAPNTDQAHEKYLRTAKRNFSQAQLSTP